MSSFTTIKPTLSTLSADVPDSKVSNTSIIASTPCGSNSSRLIQALLSLDEKYASSVKVLPQDSVSDVKLNTVPKLNSRFLARHLGNRSGKSSGAKPVNVRLVANYELAGSANTALDTVQALSPIAVQDFSSFASLYDLQRTKAMTIYWRTASSSQINGAVAGGFAFDPSNVGTYASLPDVLTAQQHVGPILMSGTSIDVSSLGTTSSSTHPGYHRFDVHLSTGKNKITNDSTASNAVGGGYVGTSDTTAIVGWIKPYIQPMGASVSSSLSMYVVYDVEFSSRT